MAVDTLKQQIEVAERNIRWKESDIEQYTKEIKEATEFIEWNRARVERMNEAIEVLGGNH